MRHARVVGLSLGFAGVALVAALRFHGGKDPSLGAHTIAPKSAESADDHASAPADRSTARSLVPPSGAPASLPCDDARRVIQQARSHLASAPAVADPHSFAEGMVDWLDPHGLWSAAPDAPVAEKIKKRAKDLVAELEAPPGSSRCDVAMELGASLGAWVSELRTIYSNAREHAPSATREEAFRLASLPAFEDGPVTKPARELSAELGRRVGTIRKVYGAPLEEASDAALARTLPPPSTIWANVVLAAAVRAYLPQIDPHGGWAPIDEETSLYEIDLEASPPPRLWRRMVRTAIGVRIEETNTPPMAPGELVLSVGEVPTACLSVEQAEQLTFVDLEASAPEKRVTVLDATDAEPRTVEISPTLPAPQIDDRGGGLESVIVPYGTGNTLVIAIGDVPDNLGDEVVASLQRARSEADITSVVLDLRGNGGGSTDGASAVLGVFLPGASLFPLRRRDGSVEVERAPSPPPSERWSGPLAALVDGDTASAAEMIAGAIAAYHRGPVVGDRTYGKGCAQEYLDDDARAGVLRLTTLVYALPDGSPVQQTGILPSVRLPMPRASEREAMLTHSLAPWRGPDVRDRLLIHETAWPGHGGSVGPCGDATVCRALRALGAPRAAVARGLDSSPTKSLTPRR